MGESVYKKASEDPAAPDAGAPEVTSGFPVSPEAGGFSGTAARRSQAGTKRIVLVGVWLILLVGLIVGIKFMGSMSDTGQGGNHKPPVNPMPKLDPVNLEAHWPQIVAQAAAPPRGSADARYTLAEFGDFQCPQCGKARPLLEKLLAQYPAQVNLIFLHRPFPKMHERALDAALASEVAAESGKFWPMYDVLYTHQDNLEPGFYGDYAVKAGLDKAAFLKAFQAKQGADKLQAAFKLADDLDIQMTPTILVRDNVAKTVTIYVGLDTNANTKASIPYTGLDKLVAAPPWAK